MGRFSFDTDVGPACRLLPRSAHLGTEIAGNTIKFFLAFHMVSVDPETMTTDGPAIFV